MPEIALEPAAVRQVGAAVADLGRQVPDPPTRYRPRSGAASVDDAVEDVMAAVSDHLLGLGVVLVRLGQGAIDAADLMVEADRA